MTTTIVWWLLAALTLAGAVAVITVREMTRLILALGVFLLGIAGLYAYFGFGLLAVAEIFVYVGGVLVLFLLAITVMGRDAEGRAIARRFDPAAATVSAGLAFVLVMALRPSPPASLPVSGVSVERTAAALLGPWLPHFEIVGVLLLVALAAALAIVGGGEDR
ncbi:MAG TPA: NADH-quinone oxidoreductase subunit J [Coriobacteriia bacterium]